MLRLINMDDGQSMTDKEVLLFHRIFLGISSLYSSPKLRIFIRRKCVIWKWNLKMRSRKIFSIDSRISIRLHSREKLSMYESVWQGSNDLMNCLKCGALLPFNHHASEHNEKVADIIT